MKRHIPIFLALSLFPVSAFAVDTWTDPFPGVRRLDRIQSGPNRRIHAVVVDLCAEGVSFRATKSSEKRRTPSSFGTLVGADIAVNGDFFSFETYNPTGFAVGDGEKWRGDPSARGWIGFGPGYADISAHNAGVKEPAWVEDAVGGNLNVLTAGTVTNNAGDFCTTRHPRTVAGFSQDRRTFYLAVVDGRQTASVGMTCAELGNLMKGLGAHDALNLDGGGSTAMWMRGPGVVNRPSDGSQRVVSNHLGIIASGTGEPEACNLHEGEVAAEFFGLDDFYVGGTSEGVPDVLVGDEFQGALRLKSKTPRRFRNVLFDYWFEPSYLSASNYEIQTDHPVYDAMTWVRNDATDHPDNPAPSAMGDIGSLGMYAFSPSETKRALLDLRANRYSIGAVDHPDIRSWVHHIDDMYGEQADYYDEPSDTNRMGVNLRAYAQLDVLSPYEWQFDEEAGDEGWTACDAAGPLAVTGGALAVDGCVASPTWTAVDATTWNQAVIKLVEPGAIAIGLGDDLIEFEGLGAGENVLDLSSVEGWTGQIQSFTVQGTALVDGLWFQSSTDMSSSSGTAPFTETTPIAPTGTDTNPNPTDPGNNNGTGGNNANNANNANNGTGTGTGGSTDGASETPSMDGEVVRGEAGGCAAANGKPSALFLLFALLFLVPRRRRTLGG